MTGRTTLILCMGCYTARHRDDTVELGGYVAGETRPYTAPLGVSPLVRVYSLIPPTYIKNQDFSSSTLGTPPFYL